MCGRTTPREGWARGSGVPPRCGVTTQFAGRARLRPLRQWTIAQTEPDEVRELFAHADGVAALVFGLALLLERAGWALPETLSHAAELTRLRRIAAAERQRRDTAEWLKTQTPQFVPLGRAGPVTGTGRGVQTSRFGRVQGTGRGLQVFDPDALQGELAQPASAPVSMGPAGPVASSGRGLQTSEFGRVQGTGRGLQVFDHHHEGDGGSDDGQEQEE